MMKEVAAALFFLSAFGIAQPAQPVWVSSLDLTKATSGWGTAQADKGIAGGPLSIAGAHFSHGYGTHAPGKLRIDLAGGAQRFQAVVGVNDSAKDLGSVEFIVLGDKKELW